MKIPERHIAVLTLLLILGSRCPAQAASVAVFPVDDLSSAYNSESPAMTEFLRHALSQRGLTVVQNEAVTDFMSARRIRQLGTLQTPEIIAARSDLQADLVLLGAVCQQNETAAAIGMTISLLRTSDAKTIWTSSKGVSLVDEQRFLGLKAPTTMADLLPILAHSLFATWPPELDLTPGPAVVGTQNGAAAITGDADAPLAIDSVFFSPKYVRPDQEVTCTLRFKSNRASDLAKVLVKVGDRVHPATSADGVYYQASWRGSAAKGDGQPSTTTMSAPDASGVSAAPGRTLPDGAHPVSLIIEGPGGRRDESYLGSYVVDSLAPDVSFKVQGKKINEVVAFRTELPVTVLFKRSEPISEWEFAVASQEGEVLLREKGSDQPPANFVWRGQDSKNLRAGAGIYAITLKVWDRARNLGETTEKVQLLAAAPGLNLTVSRRQEHLQATLAALDGVQVSSWRMELWSADSTMLKTYVGDSLPVRLVLPQFAATADQGKIECILQAKDSLGMKVTRNIPDLLAQVVSEEQDGPADTLSGHGKGDSDSWQADF